MTRTRRRPGTVEVLGPNSWRVIVDGRPYMATYNADPAVFPLDRWNITNGRGQVKAWDSAISRDVQYAIRNAGGIHA